MPFPLASSLNSLFQASKPADELPHCAASAAPPVPAMIAKAVQMAAISFLPLDIENSLLIDWSAMG
jgi:hypothetical protein